MGDLPPNHHADYPQFTGIFGFVAGLTMIVGRGRDARLVAQLAAVTADQHVVDIGCGPGTAARLTAAGGASVTGVDPSAPMLRLARLLTAIRRPRGALDWVQAGAEDMPLPDASADVVWSLASVHHWPELEAGIAEVSRVLRPGGMFLAVEKRTEPGATGNKSHGWTPQQADLFAAMLADRGYRDTSTADHDIGKRRLVVASGTHP
ncbi:MAG: class I SAM-dependent methyltransferase [Acidimicrobiales bacterium]|nr:class I SAM-dependent methyltransferase [Acidimicrobiales bacterium]